MTLPLIRRSVERVSRPHHDAPGTIREQMRAVDTYLSIPPDLRRTDRAMAWRVARALVIPHASRGVTP